MTTRNLVVCNTNDSAVCVFFFFFQNRTKLMSIHRNRDRGLKVTIQFHLPRAIRATFHSLVFDEYLRESNENPTIVRLQIPFFRALQQLVWVCFVCLFSYFLVL